MKSIYKSVVFVAAVLFLAPNMSRAQTNYGDFAASTVTYMDVTEDSNTGDTLPMYGAPTVAGNTLDFNPIGLGANSSGGGAPDITDAQLNFMIMAQSGNFVDELQFSEQGDFTMAGFGTDATYVDITATFFIDVLEVDGASITPIQSTLSMDFSPNSDGTFSLLTDGGGGPVYNGAWSGALSLDIESLLISNSVSFVNGATKISVNLDNVLVAGSEASTSAFISKKDFKGMSVTAIPEPQSAALILLLGGGIAYWRDKFR